MIIKFGGGQYGISIHIAMKIDKSKFFKAIDDYVKIVDANYPITLIENK